MGRLDLPYLWCPIIKRRQYYYYRRGGLRVRITAPDGTAVAPPDPAFFQAYERIHSGFEAPAVAKPGKGTLAELIDHYVAAPDFGQLAEKTRKDYRRYTDYLKERYGDLPVRTMPRDFVLALRDQHAATPRKANYLLQILRILFNYALDRPKTFGVTVNPVSRPKQLKTGEGHRPWEEWQLKAFRKRWPVGTWERTAFELLLNTGQRGGDVAKMVRTHCQAGEIHVRQEKTKALVWIPASRDLAEALEPWLRSHAHMAVLAGDRGKPLKVDGFRHRMIDAYEAAGLRTDDETMKDGAVTTHGLRYTSATRLRELGLDWELVGAITGHKTAEMARKYMRQRRDAAFAVAVLDTATRTPRKRRVINSSDKSDKPPRGRKEKAPET